MRGKRQQKNKKTKQPRLARRATIKIARSNRRTWCSFDVLYLSVILLSFPTSIQLREEHSQQNTQSRYSNLPCTDTRTHICIYNAKIDREREKQKRGRELTRARTENNARMSASSPRRCAWASAGAWFRRMCTLCARERSLTLINNYVSIFTT